MPVCGWRRLHRPSRVRAFAGPGRGRGCVRCCRPSSVRSASGSLGMAVCRVERRGRGPLFAGFGGHLRGSHASRALSATATRRAAWCAACAARWLSRRGRAGTAARGPPRSPVPGRCMPSRSGVRTRTGRVRRSRDAAAGRVGFRSRRSGCSSGRAPWRAAPGTRGRRRTGRAGCAGAAAGAGGRRPAGGPRSGTRPVVPFSAGREVRTSKGGISAPRLTAAWPLVLTRPRCSRCPGLAAGAWRHSAARGPPVGRLPAHRAPQLSMAARRR